MTGLIRSKKFWDYKCIQKVGEDYEKETIAFIEQCSDDMHISQCIGRKHCIP